MKNLNIILSWAHAQTIENIYKDYPSEGILIDKFASDWRIKMEFKNRNIPARLEMRVRAESDPGVAAASILARHAFLEKMSELSQKYQRKFPRGCGNDIKDFVKQFLKSYPESELKTISKTHFKTYQEITRPS